MKKIIRTYDDGSIMYEEDGQLVILCARNDPSNYELIPTVFIDEREAARNADFDWFVDNYDCIYEEYGQCFVAIKNKEIIGVYSSYAEGVHETEKEHELGTFIVQGCDGTELAYTAYI